MEGIRKVVVTYNDGRKKSFTPEYWKIFQKSIEPIATKIVYKKTIKYYLKQFKSWLQQIKKKK